jgi:hypothetical protein
MEREGESPLSHLHVLPLRRRKDRQSPISHLLSHGYDVRVLTKDRSTLGKEHLPSTASLGVDIGLSLNSINLNSLSDMAVEDVLGDII